MGRHFHDHDHRGLHGHDLAAGPHARRGRRFFRSGELHLVLLSLLAQRPQHGYELMSELQVQFGPGYNPSPGSIYPALAGLEAESLIEARDDGERKVFSVTPSGLQALREREHMLAEVEARTGARLSGGALEPALARLVARIRGVAARVDAAEIEQILDETGDHVEALARRSGPEGSDAVPPTESEEPKETGT